MPSGGGCEAPPRPILALMILCYFETLDSLCQNIIDALNIIMLSMMCDVSLQLFDFYHLILYNIYVDEVNQCKLIL